MSPPPLPWWRCLVMPLFWLLTVAGFLCQMLVLAWGSLALYYSVLPWAWLRLVLAVLFAGAGVWALWITPHGRRGFAIFAALLLGVLALWVSATPSHDRKWVPDAAVMPRAVITGDEVKITGVRDFDYQSKTDFTERWTTREVRLSKLRGVDFFISYWGPKPGLMGHTFVSFVFEDAPPLCISIEARKEQAEVYALVTSMFKQFELIYLVGEERDIVGSRTNHRDEDVYRYPLRLSREGTRQLFLGYLDSLNALADQPQFYHLLNNNCTTNIQRHALADEMRNTFYWRVLVNGLSDALLYDKGGLDTTLPFAELKQRSRITDLARAGALDTSFSERIRGR